jgi:type VI secretion system protein ImpK
VSPDTARLADAASFVQDEDPTRRAGPRAGAAAREGAGVEVRDIGALGAANPLLAAANPLLMMLRTLRSGTAPGEVGELRASLIALVDDFDAACARHDVPELDRRLANYALCAVVDEAVQLTPWGGTADWARHSLLIHFHGENWGGEKFFDILNRIAATPAKHAWLLDLFYVCLALGFMGRFHLEGPGGRQKVAELRERLYQLVRRARPELDRTLSGRWAGLQVARRRFRGFGLVGVLAGALALGCLGAFAVYALSLRARVDALQLERLALPRMVPPPGAVAPAARPRLAQLLADDVAARRLEVSDLRYESTVRFTGAALFDSGSATPSTAAGELLDRVADALRQVDGRVVVQGYTDNAPTGSLRVSNWALSKERAVNVARRLVERAGDAARFSVEGRGELDPIASNDDAEGRARNRRVEIVLKAADAAP